MQHPSLSELFAAWEGSSLPHRLRPKTRDAYRGAMRKAIAALPDCPHNGQWGLWQADLLAEGYSPAYVNHLMDCCRSVVRSAGGLLGDAYPGEVLQRVKNVPEVAAVPRCPPPDTLQVLLPLCRNYAEQAALLLCGAGGLRRGEMLGLLIEDWRPHEGVVQVVRQRRGAHRKNRRLHFVRVDPETAARLDWTVRHHDQILPQGGERPRDHWTRLFPWGLKYVEFWVRRLREALGPQEAHRYLPPRTAFHGLRHLCATTLAKQGRTQWEIAGALGISPGRALGYIAMIRGSYGADMANVTQELIYSVGVGQRTEAPQATPEGLQVPEPSRVLSSG